MHKLIQRLLVVVALSATVAFAEKGGGTTILPKQSATRPASVGVVGS